ncbi:EAL domain-containing protein (putative c-di-GMP-specific phosphodiesterase class I) [Litorivivens lipolytica]|uniref:EAL domain-containing protein (Putative c-di-GMP-specific phosphodiesterase class I) n=1 Tax=Litorivivens lipolytica TaxID=1524264 RepID=A0A7W4W7D1_9GAMM|nr:EAL domain-containing protein [Litorivivens lipolytica]MBB3048207.1 EAL domain-containing protein (putative c-di-GMP-specific phosphodiesterase class I) [Litorivivens lipolytica]
MSYFLTLMAFIALLSVALSAVNLGFQPRRQVNGAYLFLGLTTTLSLIATIAWYKSPGIEGAAVAAKWITLTSMAQVCAFVYLSWVLYPQTDQPKTMRPVSKMLAAVAFFMCVGVLVLPSYYFESRIAFQHETQLLFETVNIYQGTASKTGVIVSSVFFILYACCGWRIVHYGGSCPLPMTLAFSICLGLQLVYIGFRMLFDLGWLDEPLPVSVEKSALGLVLLCCAFLSFRQNLQERAVRMVGTQQSPVIDLNLPIEWEQDLGRNQVVAQLSGGRVYALVLVHVKDYGAFFSTYGKDLAEKIVTKTCESVISLFSLPAKHIRLDSSSVCIALEVDDLEDLSVLKNSWNEGQINKSIAQSLYIKSQRVDYSVNIGVIGPVEGRPIEEGLYLAETALLESIAQGRNRLVFYDAALANKIAYEKMLEKRLPSALLNNEFRLYYQPKVNRHGRCVGAEALLRWQQEEGRIIPPDVFIPIAERCGFMPELGIWVVNEAIAFIKTLDREDCNFPARIALNVCGLQLMDGDFVEYVEKALIEARIPASKLEFELTESALVTEAGRASSQLQYARDLGVSIAVDDFGTGYSSLSYLQSFPLDSLKVDKSFVDKMDTERGEKLVAGIVDIARALGMSVVVEGVETREQLNKLVDMNCHQFQGYLFSRPLTEQDFITWLSRNRPLSLVG